MGQFSMEISRPNGSVLSGTQHIYGIKRIVGSFTEASAFAFATMGAAAFSLRLWLGGVRPVATFTLAVMSIALVILSTSTTGYVGLPVLLVCVFAECLWGIRGGRIQTSAGAFLLFTPLLCAVVITGILLNPSTAQTVWSFINVLVLDKSSSESAIDRGSWNAAAMDAFWGTYGLGAGIGSVRASSFILAVLSNLGLFGGFAFGAAILLILVQRAKRPLGHDVREIRAAARMACLAILIAASISGALIDLGLPFFIFAALASGATNLEPLHPLGRQPNVSTKPAPDAGYGQMVALAPFDVSSKGTDRAVSQSSRFHPE